MERTGFIFEAFLALLLVRHLPQRLDGLGRCPSNIRKTQPVPVRAVYIGVLWFTIMTGTAARLWLRPPTAGWTFATGWSLLVVGIVMALLAYMKLGWRYRDELVIFEGASLVQDGIYSVVRHPYRLGLICEMLGAVLISSAWCLLPVWAIAVAGLLYRSRQEDGMLRDYYGLTAAEYQVTVPAWNLVTGLLRLIRKTKSRG